MRLIYVLGVFSSVQDDVYWINNDEQRLMVGSEYSAGIAIIAATLTEPTVTMLIISNISQSCKYWGWFVLLFLDLTLVALEWVM